MRSDKYSRIVSLARSRTTRLVQGINTDTDNSDDIWPGSNSYTGFATSAVKLEAISDDANDHASSSPTGARTLYVEYLDSDWNFVSEVLSMNGTSATDPTSSTAIRLLYAEVVTAGSSAANEGTITIRGEGGGATFGTVPVGVGVTQQAIFSVPRAHKAVVHSLHIRTDATAAGTPGRIAVLARKGADGAAPVVSRILDRPIITETDPVNERFEPGSIVLPEKTDIWCRTIAGASDDTAMASFEIELFCLQTGTPIQD